MFERRAECGKIKGCWVKREVKVDTISQGSTGGENEVGCWHRRMSIRSSENCIVVEWQTNTHACTHTRTHRHTHTTTFAHANSDIMHGCPLRFIIKALSGCAGSEGENMNRIKQIVWCVKDRHSSSKVLKLLLPMDWQGMRVGARNECSSLLFPSPFPFITRSFQTVASLFMQGPSVSTSNVN